MKLNILVYLANELNIGDMLNELGEYATDVDVELSKKSIEAMGQIAIKLRTMAVPIIKQLSSYINPEREYITNIIIVKF